MRRDELQKIMQFVADNIGDFHASRLNAMTGIKLKDLLKTCNPYLCRAKNLVCAQDFIRALFDVRLSRSEQTIFGAFLESIAVFTVQEMYDGKKTGAEGIDLEFFRDDTYYVVSVKSGPNWGNSSATKKQKELFTRTAKTIRQNKHVTHVRPVLGCCFGKSNADMGDYDKYCGQKFWHFLSRDDRMYIDIIEPLGHQAKERDQAFKEEYGKCLNLLTAEFMKKYCRNDGGIDWEALIKLNSEQEEKRPPKKRASKKRTV